jgi:uncharacterized damage-inducible protein DinB
MPNAFVDNYRWLAHYNQWFNQRLYDACEALSDAERKQDRGAFFRSIHHTLNHIVVGDQVWLKRLRQCCSDHGLVCASLGEDVLDLPGGATLSTVLFDDWTALRRKRTQLDHGIVDWLAQIPADFPGLTMRYANTEGVERVHPTWQALTHFFNHQTHHGGQVTTLLAQAGVDVGVTDMVALL